MPSPRTPEATSNGGRFDVDPRQTARSAGLHYVTDDEPGFSRARWGQGFTYRHPDGTTLKDRSQRRRIEGLVIPPAWTDVWICTRSDGHLQATGRDDRDRKQYLYHPRWRAARDRMKFKKLVAFGHELPMLRRRIGGDLELDGFPRAKALAAAVRLLDRTAIRVGNERYANRNKSYGLTTLRTRHVEDRGQAIRLSFAGKGGRSIEHHLYDQDLVAVLQEALEMPGWHLLQYVDSSGAKRRVEAGDVNAYIRNATGGPFTAKDFRSWMATVRVVNHLRSLGRVKTKRGRLTHWLEAVDLAAAKLTNTRAVVRSSYLPPDLEPLYMEGTLFDQFEGHDERADQLRCQGRNDEECWALAFLEDLVALPLRE